MGLVYGVDAIWIGGNVGVWSDAANWQDGTIPGQVGDTATFTNGYAMTAITLDRDAALDKIVVGDTRLNLYSPAGKTLTFTGNAPEIAVGNQATFRTTGAKLVSTASVKKSGSGRFVTVGRASDRLKFVQYEGAVELEGETRETVTVTTGDANWESQANSVTTGAEVTGVSPFGTDPGSLVVGDTLAVRTGVTGCRKPIKVDTSFSFSADVEMTGESAYGFAIAFHNDPRGHLAHTIHKGEYTESLGYGAISKNSQSVTETRVVNSFGFGIYNLYYGNGNIRWGTNGDWTGAEKSNPLIYTATGASDGSANYWTRWYSVRVDYDAFRKRATLTLVQDQREIVEGGQADVTYSKTINDVDLVKLCGSDEAFLGLTFSEGGRNILATLRNVKLEYVQSDTTVLAVVPSENLWSNIKCYYNTMNDAATGLSPYGASYGSIRVGYGASLYETVSARNERVPVTGDLRISGKVTDNGSGAHGFCVVLHNDPRGPLAHAFSNAGGVSLGYASGDANSIVKSVAFGIYNYAGKNGYVAYGKSGVWEKNAELTNPKIITAPRGDSHSGNSPVQRKYDFTAGFDSVRKTLTLVLSQEQNGQTVSSTHVFSGVDVPSLCGDEKAYLTLTSEAGGASIDVTIDDFVYECAKSRENADACRFFESFEQKDSNRFVSVSSVGENASLNLASSTSFAAGARLSVLGYEGTLSLGVVSVAGDMELASAPKTVAVKSDGDLWNNTKCVYNTQTDVATGLSPYGNSAGSIRIGYNLGSMGTVSARRERIPVIGDFRISGKVTDNGSGAHGFAVVLHNDPRGCLAHCTPLQGGGTLGYANTDGSSITRSVAFGIETFASYNGKVRFGRGGVFGSRLATSPKIITAPRGDNHSGNSPVQRKYDFTAAFDSTRKTLTLVLSQEQEGVTVVSTNVYADVDVPSLCGDERAYLSLTSESGGSTVDATIDDFRVDYAAPTRVTYSSQGAIVAPARAAFTLDGAAFAVEQDRQIGFDAYRLWGDAVFAFADACRLLPITVEREGVPLGDGAYTASTSTWITGAGTVLVTGRGTVLILR